MVQTIIYFFLLLPFTLPKPTLDVTKHLYQYGFLKSQTADPTDVTEAIKKFQSVNKLQITGEVNPETLARMQSPRCGKPDSAPNIPQTSRTWNKPRLTYKIYNWSAPLSKEQIRDEFAKSITYWTSRVDLDIVETDSDKADILIHFAKQDGPFETLGYAYFPENGGIFLDQDERWALDHAKENYTNFGWVATHELGHAIGLHHSNYTESVMFPYYLGDVFSPDAGDVESLESLYGRRVFNNTVLCSRVEIDAILDGENPLVIVGKNYWTSFDGHVRRGPFELSEKFPDLPDKIDAAFVVGPISYFLSDDAVHRRHPNKALHPKHIPQAFDGLPGGIDAAFHDPASSMVYFFKGSKYYALTIRGTRGKRLVVNGRSIENDWKGLPKNIDGATLFGRSQALFVKSFNCYLVDLESKNVTSTEECSAYYKCK